MRYYLVGGAVRDLLLGIAPDEFDIAFDGPVDVFLQTSGPLRKVGRDRPVYIADGRDTMPLRGASLRDDLLLRDFTINALALDETGRVYALPQTFADLRAGRIRHASLSAFVDDPARIFRAARFAATLPGFHVLADTLNLMRRSAESSALTNIAAERVGRECMKALAGSRPALFFTVLAEANALHPWLAELEQARDISAGPPRYHGTNTVFTHTLHVMENTAASAAGLSAEGRSLALWMALCHDLGKTGTPPEELPRHIGHETRGEVVAAALARRLRLPLRWEKSGILAARLHTKAGNYFSLRPGARVDLLHTLHAARLFAPFFAMVTADAGNPHIAALAAKDLAAMLPVSLPPKFHNQGKASAAKLRELRAQAIKLGDAVPQAPCKGTESP